MSEHITDWPQHGDELAANAAQWQAPPAINIDPLIQAMAAFAPSGAALSHADATQVQAWQPMLAAS